MTTEQSLANRYVAAWNETDPDRRRKAIEALWIPEGKHFVDTRQAIGHEALQIRVSTSHEKNVTKAGNRFRAVQDARRLHDSVTFHWQMLPRGRDEILATGFEILLVNENDQILVDYQFVL
jgi:hypothetical protein